MPYYNIILNWYDRVLRVQVDPVAGNVDGHAQLEEESVLRVEEAERHH